MAFSDAAIGFFLQMEDEMTPQLPGAVKAYEKFINTLTKLNQKGFAGTQGFLGSMGSLVKSVEKMTGGSEAKLNVGLSKKSEKGLGDVVGKAVMQALSKVKLRLTASLPKKKLKMFSQEASLRTLYGDIPQPPDMAGKFDLPKFAKGGKVPGTGNKDSVLGLLTPGEEIIPTDLVDKIDAAMDRLGTSREALGAGFGNKKDLKGYKIELQETADAMDALTEATQEAGFETSQRLAPQITQMRGRFEELGAKMEKKVMPTFKEFFEKVLGPVRFLAVSQGLRAVQEGFTSLRAGASSTFSTLGGDEIGSGIESLNKMNQFLGVGRDELAAIKVRAGTTAKAIEGVGFDELAFSLAQLAELGVRNEETLFRLATSSSLAAKGMGVAQEAAGNLGFDLTKNLGFSQEGFESVLASLGQLSNKTNGFNISAQELFSQTVEDTKKLSTTLASMSDKEGQGLLNTFNQIGAALKTNFVDGGAEIRQVLAGALEGNVDDIRKSGILTGMGFEELRATLKDGDVEGIFESIGRQAKKLDPKQMLALAEATGITSKDLGNLAKNQEGINESLRKGTQVIVPFGKGMAELELRAQNNQTGFEKLKESFTDSAAAVSLFGISGVEALDFLKEFNIVSIFAIGTMLKSFIPAIFSMGAALFGLNGVTMATSVSLTGLGKGMLLKLGPLALLAAGVTALVMKIQSLGAELNKIEEDRREDQAFTNKNADQGRRINSAKKQLARLEASGKLSATRRGKGETSFLSDSQQQLKVQLQQQLLDANVGARKRAGKGPTADEIAALQVQIAEGKGQGDLKQLKQAETQTELMKEMVASLKNQENAAPTKHGYDVLSGATNPAVGLFSDALAAGGL